MSPRILERAKISCQKLLSESLEQIHLADYVVDVSTRPLMQKDPFPHLVIDNFFHESYVRKLEEHLVDTLSRGLGEGIAEHERFHRFDQSNYYGYVYRPTPTLETNDPFSLFFSITWNRYISSLFHQFTTLETNVALHHHTPHDPTLYIHHDHVNKYFHASSLANGIRPHLVKEEKNTIEARRTIALIYYYGNDEWEKAHGGETGLYSTALELFKCIEPRNNRLFGFVTSESSFHAFQGNKRPRNSLIQWFHLYDRLR